MKDVISVEADGLREFFIEKWGTRETLRDNRDALLALYNYLLGMKSQNKGDIMEKIKRQRFEQKEESE